MRIHGWKKFIAVIGLAMAAAAVPAHAGGYVLSIQQTGPDLDPGPQFGVLPGQQFDVIAVLTGDPFVVHDSSNFDVGFTGPRDLIYNKYLWDPVAYDTGGANDTSVPEVDPGTGLFPAGVKPLINNGLYPVTPARADVHFGARTRAGQTFGTGTIVTLTLKMPADAQVGEKFLIQPFPVRFLHGSSLIPTSPGSSLGVVVIPEPATLVLLGLGGLAAVRRRLFQGLE